MTFSRRTGAIVTAAGLIWLAHAVVISAFGTHGRGPLLSDVVQLCLGGVLIFAIFDAALRSEGFSRSFWRLTAAAYGILVTGQALGVWNDLSPSPTLAWTTNLLFTFWFIPLGLALFLDPEHETGSLDAPSVLDFVQAILFCVAAYLYFFYLPKAESPGELAHEVWTPYFVGYAIVAVALVLRALSCRSRDGRALFGRIGLMLVVCVAVDAAYYYGPGRTLSTGAWFDLLWSALLLIPLGIAATWSQTEPPELPLESPRREKPVYAEMFHLLFPLLVLLMSLRIARERLGLAGLVVFFSFVCSSARLLVTQNRLVLAKDALRREASRDGLTSLWNRKSILQILDRELLRAERDRAPVGVIMIDVDHFKKINDEFLHAAGDAVLRIIASSIAAVVRPYDSVGRVGGEEFLIVAPGCGLTETWELAERVRAHVATCNFMAAGTAVHVSLSLGIATGEAAADAEKVLHAADSALYQAKNAGRNRVEPGVGRAAGAGQSSSPSPGSDFWL